MLKSGDVAISSVTQGLVPCLPNTSSIDLRMNLGGMKQLRPAREVVQDWLAELAEKVGRPVDEIQAKGLGAYDFSSGAVVEVRFQHGHTHRFTYAFAVIKPEQHLAAVFTEHAGYVEFELADGTQVVEIKETVYYHET